MRRAIQFLLVLVVGLGLLTFSGWMIMSRTTKRWIERDVALRSRLAVTSAQGTLLKHWESDRQGLSSTLADITRDERIMGAAACSIAGERLAETDDFPKEFSCRALLQRMRDEGVVRALDWTTTAELPAGPVQVSVVSIGNEGSSLGSVILVHDLRYAVRREVTTRNLLLAAFGILAVGASAFTLFSARFAWRQWTRELRSALTGTGRGEFAPLVRDVRAMVNQLVEEQGFEARTGEWSPERLRATLKQYLHGERVVILANREPYIHEATSEGVRVVHPASGLVTALEPVMRACSGVWVAHGSGSADRQTVDAHDHVAVPPGENAYSLRRVWLSEEEESGYYYGFSNEGLWPLCHVAHTRPVFRAADWEHYVKVNQKFADAVCAEVDVDDPIILVQDYHFALAPKLIREKLPRATIIVFWHIPWPGSERIGMCPWREQLLAGLLGASIVGFHTRQHCNNFIDSVDAFMEARTDREANAIVQQGRRSLIRAYPISVEWPVRWLDGVPDVVSARREVRLELGISLDALVGVGIDRLDYTKGIEERLLAVDNLLERHPEFRNRFTFVQLAAPSRTRIARYQELNERVENLTEEINARWGTESYQPIVLLRSHHEPSTVFRYYRAAELCYVSSLHDGMNLVAKEFVASRDDEQGVLVLSEFTGAARDLTEAVIVNPYDVQRAGDALAVALSMSSEEQRERMKSMRRAVAEFNVYRWAGRMLVDAAELRRRERMTGRLGAFARTQESETL